jgi:hypothetical protein
MNCLNHPEMAAIAPCTGCAESFCARCLVTIKSERYCGSCKTMAVPAAASAVQVPCKEASDALKYAIVGLLILGPILEPIAMARAFKARALLKGDPTLTGIGKANVALMLSTIVILLWVFGFVRRFASP